MGYSRHKGHQATKERFSLVSRENSEGFEFVGGGRPSLRFPVTPFHLSLPTPQEIYPDFLD